MQLILSRTVLFLALVVSALAAENSAKPPVGVPADAVFFNGNWYRVYLEKTTWRRAEEKCQRLGGHLAVVPDAQTEAFIVGLANKLVLWLGGTDEKVEGRWMWVDGKEMTYRGGWTRGEPKPQPQRNYLALGAYGKWYDAPDQWRCVGYICEWRKR
jgi:hypothetical protein